MAKNFDFIIPTVSPSFLKGEDAEALYNEVCKTINPRTIKSGVWYDTNSKTMKGSSTFLAARVDSIVRPLGIRVATLADLSRPEIMEMIGGVRHYSDTPAIVFRSMENIYEPNNLLIKQLAPMVEEKVGKLELPVLVTGFDVVSSKDGKGYGLDIVARKDFAVLHDKRLSVGYNGGGRCGESFSTVDENGLPNFEENGNNTWCTGDKGLSRLYLNLVSILNLYDDDLADSYDDGRIILVRDEVKKVE